MISIVKEGRTIAKFERFEGNKAMDWITQKGLYIKHKTYVDDSVIWEVEPLP